MRKTYRAIGKGRGPGTAVRKETADKRGESANVATITVDEARSRWDDVLDRVESGESFTILREGVPVAEIHAPTEKKRDIEALFEEMCALRKGNRLRGLSVREMIEEGRP